MPLAGTRETIWEGQIWRQIENVRGHLFIHTPPIPSLQNPVRWWVYTIGKKAGKFFELLVPKTFSRKSDKQQISLCIFKTEVQGNLSKTSESGKAGKKWHLYLDPICRNYVCVENKQKAWKENRAKLLRWRKHNHWKP